MIRSSSVLAALMAAGVLSACDKPINDGPYPQAENKAPAAAVPAPSEIPTTSGGPAGQTPAYGEPGAAPSQVTSQPDQTGPSDSDSSGSVR